MEERRRHPRRPAGRETAVVQANVDVRVLDISSSGALLQSTRPLEPGARARLRLTLGGVPFSTDVVIQRVAPVMDGSLGFYVGTEFVGVTPDAQQLIDAFISEQ